MFVKTLRQKCTLPLAGVRKTTSQAFWPRAKERKWLALSLIEKAAKKKTVSESDFCVTFLWSKDDAVSFSEANLETEKQVGKPVAETNLQT